MYVKGIIVEQIDWDGTSKSLVMRPDPSVGDLIIAFPPDYDEPRNGPFYFQNPSYEEKYNVNIGECRARKIVKDNFSQDKTLYTFKAIWHRLPTERGALTYYALYLPEYAVIENLKIYDPQNSNKEFMRTVLIDKQKKRYIVYLKCSSSHGFFNFNLFCQFREDKAGFSSSNFVDDFQTDLYDDPEKWKLLLTEGDKEKAQQFFENKINR